MTTVELDRKATEFIQAARAREGKLTPESIRTILSILSWPEEIISLYDEMGFSPHRMRRFAGAIARALLREKYENRPLLLN